MNRAKSARIVLFYESAYIGIRVDYQVRVLVY